VKLSKISRIRSSRKNYLRLPKLLPFDSFQAIHPSTGLFPLRCFAAPEGVLCTTPSVVWIFAPAINLAVCLMPKLRLFQISSSPKFSFPAFNNSSRFKMTPPLKPLQPIPFFRSLPSAFKKSVVPNTFWP
jgi:hypothetical protein